MTQCSQTTIDLDKEDEQDVLDALAQALCEEGLIVPSQQIVPYNPVDNSITYNVGWGSTPLYVAISTKDGGILLHSASAC
eukprot:1936187-Amphidinium_carterae.1